MSVYFVQSIDGGPIKIGYSFNVEARLEQLERHYGKPLAILATMPGGRAEETSIHRRFAHLRCGRTEQFRPAPELMSFIDRPLFVNQGDVSLMEPADYSPDLTAVKIDRTLVGKARLIATHRGISVAELFSDMLRVPVDKAYAQMLRDLEGKGGPSK